MGFSKDGNGQVLVCSNCPRLDFWILCFLFMGARTLELVAGTR
jgi:hypothetical protein